MNRIKKYLSLSVIGFALLLSGCEDNKTVRPLSWSKTDNSKISVELVLTHDGIKIYRFWDGWKYVYYTDARGKTQWEERTTVGKRTIITPYSVETAE